MQTRATTNRNRRRLATVLLAPAAALVAWGIARLFEIDLAVSTGTVGAGDVVAAALAGASAGWLVALLVERRSRRPQATWAFVGSTALSVSIVGPSWLADGAAAVAARHATAAEIAAHLHLSEGTVRNYLSAAIQKLDARNRIEALRTAQEKGWL